MIVRVFFVIELVLGVLLAGARLQYLPMHMGFGFLVAICVALLAIMACVKRMFGIGVVGLFFAILLPITGIKQFPLKFGVSDRTDSDCARGGSTGRRWFGRSAACKTSQDRLTKVDCVRT